VNAGTTGSSAYSGNFSDRASGALPNESGRFAYAADPENLVFELAEGRSPNVFDEIAKTPLRYAAEREHLDVMRVRAR